MSAKKQQNKSRREWFASLRRSAAMCAAACDLWFIKRNGVRPKFNATPGKFRSIIRYHHKWDDQTPESDDDSTADTYGK